MSIIAGHKKMVAKLFVTVDGYTVGFNELYGVLEELMGCDGHTEAMIIYNDDVAQLLGAGGYANKNTRGAWYRSNKTEELLDALGNLNDFPTRG